MSALIYLTIILATNLAVLVLIFILYRKSSKVAKTAEEEFQNIVNSKKQIEALQNKFKESLEQIISNDKLVIENSTQALAKYYQDTITTLTLNYNQNSEKLMQLLNEELRKKVSELAEIQHRKLQESKEVVEVELKKEIALMQAQVEKYTKEKLAKVDEKIYEIVTETAKNTVGKVINIVDHQQLVMNALEQAKRDKFFS